MIITRTPLRISLFGGGTDMPEFYSKNVGHIVSFAINKYIYVVVNKKFDDGIRVSYSKTENVEFLDEIQHDLVRESMRLFRVFKSIEIASVADIPGEGTGLGSSSAFTVGLINALMAGQPPAALAERAHLVEREMCHYPVGKQDHYASAHGGMNLLRFNPKSVEVKPIYHSREFESCFLMLYTGITRHSGEILKEQGKNFSKGDTVEYGREMAKIALNFHGEYVKGNMTVERTCELISQSWELKKQLTGAISTPEIDAMIQKGLNAGACGAKLLGAGGGGFLLFVAPPEKHNQVIQATGLRHIPFKIENEGSTMIYAG